MTVAEEQALADAKGAPPKENRNPVPQPLGGMFSRSLDGWAIGPEWLDQLALNDDKILSLEGYSPDLEVFDALLDDPVAFSTFQQRRLDVVSKPWEVEAGHDDGLSKKAADHLREQLKNCNWDDATDKMLHTGWYGYGVGEPIWEYGRDGLLKIDRFFIPNRAWFGFNNGGGLLMRTDGDPHGQPVPPRKFWVARSGGSHSAQHYGVGLAHWCYWPIWFKKNVQKFWALFLEKFGMPTVKGTFPPHWEHDEDKLTKFMQALQAIGTDSAVMMMEGAEIDTIEGQRSGSGAASYDQFMDKMDAYLTRVILSQTMTSTAGPAGLGSSQADVQESKGLAIAQSDSDMILEPFNNGPAKWLTEWNFPGAAPPKVYRKLEDDEDLNTTAERDSKLFAMGWRRTEESMKETYGEGFERKPEPVMLPGADRIGPDGKPLPPPPGQKPVPQLEDKRTPEQQAKDKEKTAEFAARFPMVFAARDPRPLYIMREVLNTADVMAWARGQGFKNLKPATSLHVTQLYCPTPVDQFALAEKASWTPEKVTISGGPRVVEPLGDKGVIVLQLASPDMQWRHRELVEAGAMHNHPEFWPHMTFANDAEGVDLATVEPFTGDIRLGPEIWMDLDDDGKPFIPAPPPVPIEFSAQSLDAVDRLVMALGNEADKAVLGMIEPVRAAVGALGDNPDPEQLRFALLNALERMDTTTLAKALADPMVALHAAEAAGLGSDAVA